MKIRIYKYQGAGNDFVVIDNRKGDIKLSTKQIKLLCDRRFGIGSDGLMTIEKSKKYSFRMRYYNADGKEGTMCGNGGRCITAFAHYLGFKNFIFQAIDGIHSAKVLNNPERTKTEKIISLQMKDVDEYSTLSKHSYFLDTGSPHYVEFVKDLKEYPVETKGKYWRYFFKDGANVNFVEENKTHLAIRTYERGVEAETWACGTGATASAIAAYIHKIKPHKTIQKVKELTYLYNIKALGGDLMVEFSNKESKFYNIVLTGPATLVFSSVIEI